ncbi:MAG: hypothetical protein AVDCRST_MAG12-1712, partial [uncultured Rubrobacteraceae bacterium]
ERCCAPGTTRSSSRSKVPWTRSSASLHP